jgi:hypothetical protein
VIRNKWARFVVTLLLGSSLVNVKNMIGRDSGNDIAMFGGLAIIYALVEIFRRSQRPDLRC